MSHGKREGEVCTVLPHLTHSIQSKVSFEPEKREVSIASLKKICCHQHPHVHVHWNELWEEKKLSLGFFKY